MMSKKLEDEIKDEKAKEDEFKEWLDTLRDSDDELFEIVKLSTEIVLKGIGRSSTKKSLLAIYSLMWKINMLKYSIFNLCENDGMYSAKILYRVLMEHWLKANYILLRFTNEKTDEVGDEYLTFCALDEDVKYGKSIKWLGEIITAKKCGLDPWDILMKHKPKLSKYSKKEVQQKAEKFNYREIANYILRNKLPGDNFIEAIISEYSELSSYVHGGPKGMDNMVGLSQNRFQEYKGMVRFAYNINKTNINASYMVFALFVDKSLFSVMESIGKVAWV